MHSCSSGGGGGSPLIRGAAVQSLILWSTSGSVLEQDPEPTLFPECWKRAHGDRKWRPAADGMFAGSTAAFVLLDRHGNLWVGVCGCNGARWRGALPTCPPGSPAAVCRTMWSPRCSRQNNPHSYTHESVHLAPHAHIKPRSRAGTGTVLLSWHLADTAAWDSSSVGLQKGRPRGGAAHGHLAVTERWNGEEWAGWACRAQCERSRVTRIFLH